MHEMNREERAKQFMPFGALKGYPEALKRREKKPLPRRELSEESLEELNRRQSGDLILFSRGIPDVFRYVFRRGCGRGKDVCRRGKNRL